MTKEEQIKKLCTELGIDAKETLEESTTADPVCMDLYDDPYDFYLKDRWGWINVDDHSFSASEVFKKIDPIDYQKKRIAYLNFKGYDIVFSRIYHKGDLEDFIEELQDRVDEKKHKGK